MKDSKTAQMVLYLGTVFLGMFATFVLYRYGSRTLGAEWMAGAMLLLGWASTMASLVSPALDALIWTIPVRSALADVLRGTSICLAAFAIIFLVPAVQTRIEEMTKVEPLFIAVLLCAGLVRSYAQSLSTLLVRKGSHAKLITTQYVGRLAELGLGFHASVNGRKDLLTLSLCLYPATQLVVVSLELALYGSEPTFKGRSAGAAKSSFRDNASNMLASVVDLVVPTVWLQLTSAATFLGYKIATAVLALVLLIPKYYAVLIRKRQATSKSEASVDAALVAMAAAGVLATQTYAGVTSPGAIGFIMVGVVINTLFLRRKSQLRQSLLERGNVILPAVANVAGRLMELVLLGALCLVADGNSNWPILAMIGNIVGFWIMKEKRSEAGSIQSGERA